VLAVLALGLLRWSGGWRWGLEVMVVPVVFMAGCMTSAVDTGFRQVLPIVPFVLVMIGSLGVVSFPLTADRLPLAENPSRSHSGSTWARWALQGVVAVMVGWVALSSVSVYPDYLAYFNEIAGGPAGGHRYLGDSNLDWGQDVLELEEFVAREDIREPVHVWLHSRTAPEQLGFVAEWFRQRKPEPGWYAISETILQGIYEQDMPARWKALDWLKEKKPVAILGHTIRVYHVEEPAEADSRD